MVRPFHLLIVVGCPCLLVTALTALVVVLIVRRQNGG